LGICNRNNVYCDAEHGVEVGGGESSIG
jgi:hypothetical protein